MAGRPKFEFDLGVVEQLAGMQCTIPEIAAVVGCSPDTVRRRIKDDEEFAAIVDKGREGGKSKLRHAQWKNAIGGNTTMQIFLGKQYLGQKDRQETEFKEVAPLVIAPDDSSS
jgi:predicted transcriptional regulator